MNKEICETCGRELKYFMHNCSESSNYFEFFGCPYCDDYCPECLSKEVENER